MQVLKNNWVINFEMGIVMKKCYHTDNYKHIFGKKTEKAMVQIPK